MTTSEAVSLQSCNTGKNPTNLDRKASLKPGHRLHTESIT